MNLRYIENRPSGKGGRRFLVVFQCHELFDASGVTAAFKGSFQPDVGNFKAQLFANHAGTDGQNVGVVVLSRQAGGHQVGDQCATDTLDLVGGDGDADAGGAADDTAVAFAGSNCLGRRSGKIGIVTTYRASAS